MTGRLHPADVEAIAARVVELLREVERPKPAGVLLTASEAAERLGVDRDFIYRHADELGAVRLGNGPRSRLRFPAAALDAWTAFDGSKKALPPSSASQRGSRRRAPRATAGGNPQAPELLPIRGAGGAL